MTSSLALISRLRRGPSIRYLLLAANAFILLLPLFAVLFLHLWQGHLVRVTEQQLIAESVVIAAAWRDRLREELGAAANGPSVDDVGPLEPILPLGYELLPPPHPPQRWVTVGDRPERRAAMKLENVLRQAELSNASAARILDRDGCIIAGPAGELGACLDHLPEVHEGSSGQYAAVARQRTDYERQLDHSGMSSDVRVYTVTPIRVGGQLVGMIAMTRSASSPLEAVWSLRYAVLLALVVCLGLTLMVSLFLSRGISRPVRAITRAAEAIARGEPAQPLSPNGFAPAEVSALSGALERMTAQLSDRATYIAQFATNMSHELKTPLTAIRGAVELLRDEAEGMSDEQRRRFLDNIHSDTARMEHLVNRTLELARIQSVPEAAEELDLHAFLRDLAERYDGQVQLDLGAAPSHLRMNPDHLEAAVRNLIDNAVRHGGSAPVEIRVRPQHGQVEIAVTDHGAGISAGNRARIFDRFFTTERDRGGTGLGLAIVKAVAETRGGSVSFDSDRHGTTFRLVV